MEVKPKQQPCKVLSSKPESQSAPVSPEYLQQLRPGFPGTCWDRSWCCRLPLSPAVSRSATQPQGICRAFSLGLGWPQVSSKIRFPTGGSDGEYEGCAILRLLLCYLDDLLEAKVERSSWDSSSSPCDPKERVVLSPLLGEGSALPTLGPCGRWNQAMEEIRAGETTGGAGSRRALFLPADGAGLAWEEQAAGAGGPPASSHTCSSPRRSFSCPGGVSPFLQEVFLLSSAGWRIHPKAR